MSLQLVVRKIGNTCESVQKTISIVFMYLSQFLIATMTLGILVQIVMRYVLTRPIAWIEEYCVFAMFLLSFLMGPYLFFYRLNIRMTLFYDTIRSPTVKLIVDIVLNLMMIAGLALLLPSLLDIVSSNMGVENTQIPLSKGQVYSIAPISFFLIITVFIRHIIRDIWAVVSKNNEKHS